MLPRDIQRLEHIAPSPHSRTLNSALHFSHSTWNTKHCLRPVQPHPLPGPPLLGLELL